MKKGDIVYHQNEYNLDRGYITKINKTTVEVVFNRIDSSGNLVPFSKKCKLGKVAHEDESIALIWETWKGVNGRGGYRIERDLYPDKRQPAKMVRGSFYCLAEIQYGVLK